MTTAMKTATKTLEPISQMGAWHRGRRGARLARRDDGEYREYLTEEQRRQAGCIAGRMPAPFVRWVLVSWSSGKDSAWMVHVLRSQGHAEIGALLTTINEPAQRVAMHAVRVELLEAQAAALGLPLWTVPIPSPCSNDEYERAMAAAVARAVAEGFTHAAFGDLFLEDIRRYREERLAGTGLAPLFPLFGSDTTALAHEMIAAGLRARLTCVDPRVLDRRFAGRDFDATLLADLPPSIDPCGERGEFHSFAYDGPMFSQPIPIESGIVVERDGFVFADLTLASSGPATRLPAR